MTSPLERADDARFDVLVLGGSFEGVLTALELSMSGHTVLVVEPRDVAWGSTGLASRQLVAGRHALALGVRDAFRERLGERLEWAHLAPHVVRATPVLAATPGPGGARLDALRDAWCRLQARTSPASLAWPDPMPLSAEQRRLLAPGFVPRDGTARPVAYGATVDDRLLASLFARAAVERGALVATRCEVLRVDPHERGRARVEVRDSLDGALARAQVRAIVDASGWWSRQARASLGLRPAQSPRFTRRLVHALVPHALHAIVVVEPGAKRCAPAALVPVVGGLLAGPLLSDPSEAAVEPPAATPSEGAELATLVARTLPEAGPVAARTVVASFDAGARPSRRSALERCHGVPLLTLPSVGFPHERAAARAAVARLVSIGVAPSLDSSRPLARLDGGELASVAGLESAAVADGLSAQQARWLVARHGANWEEVLADCGDEGRAPLGRGPAPLRAEVSWALRREGVRTLSDLMLRWRTPEITIDDDAEDALVADAGAALAEDAGWSSARLERELLRWERERAIVYGSGAEQDRVAPMRPRPEST